MREAGFGPAMEVITTPFPGFLVLRPRRLEDSRGFFCESYSKRCPVIILPHAGFAYEPLVAFFGGYGIALGFDRAALSRAAEAAPAFPAYYAGRFVDIDRQILEFVADAGRYFGLSELQRATS